MSLEEYTAVRQRVGISDLSHDGKYPAVAVLLLSGEDRTIFLQNLISNDISLVTGTRGIYATLLTAKGKIIADLYIYPFADAYLLTIESSIAEKTIQHLMRFKFRSKINIVDPQWGKILVTGPKALLLLQKHFKLPAMEEVSIFYEESNLTICVRQPQTGEETYHVYYPKAAHEEIWTTLLSLGEPFGVAKIGSETLDMLRIEAGIPRYGIDLTEEIIPIEAGLADSAISYTKGCYPGQEVVARIRTYGHVNKHRMGLIFNGRDAPSAGEKIFYDSVEVGWVTAGTFSPLLNKPIATAYLRTSVAIAGMEVAVAFDGQTVFATVTNLPFYHQQNLIKLK